MKCFVAFLWIALSTSSAFSQSLVHTIHWEKGVNKKVVRGWAGSLDKISDISSTTYIKKKSGGEDKLHSSGHRDVIVWIPETTDLTKNFTVVLWFHGHRGYVPHRTFEDRTLKQFVPLAKAKNFIVVIPEMPWSVHGKTPTKRNSLVWQKPGSFFDFISQVERILVRHSVNKLLEGIKDAKTSAAPIGKMDYKVVGHSAGGSTIKRLGITGDLCKLGPSMVVWSDSSYGKWLDNAWDGCLKNHPDILVKVFVHKGGSPWRNATRFLGQFQDPPENLRLYIKSKGWSHKLIGNNAVKLSNLLGDTNEAN